MNGAWAQLLKPCVGADLKTGKKGVAGFSPSTGVQLSKAAQFAKSEEKKAEARAKAEAKAKEGAETLSLIHI